MEKYAFQVFNGTVHNTEKWFNILHIGTRILFFGICAIISLFPLYWSIANIVGYIELLLFSAEGWIVYKTKKAMPEDTHVLTDYEANEDEV